MIVKEIAANVDYYAPIKERVLRARENFLSWTDSLPNPTNTLVKKLSRSNKEGSLPGALLGERDAFWVGELMGAPEKIQQMAAIGCISGYAYIIHQDHRIDEGEQLLLQSELAQNVLFAKLIESFQEVADDERGFWYYFNQYLREYTLGCLWESQDGRLPRQYSRKDLQMVANRSALIKTCISSLALATGKEREIPRFCAGTENLIIALQIRDDLADCVEDFERGRYTYPISRLLSGTEPSIHRLQRAALHTDTIERLLDESDEYLYKTSQVLELPQSSALQLYLEYLSNENRLMKTQVVTAQKEALPYLEVPKHWGMPLGQCEALLWDEIKEAICNDIQY